MGGGDGVGARRIPSSLGRDHVADDRSALRIDTLVRGTAVEGPSVVERRGGFDHAGSLRPSGTQSLPTSGSPTIPAGSIAGSCHPGPVCTDGVRATGVFRPPDNVISRKTSQPIRRAAPTVK